MRAAEAPAMPPMCTYSMSLFVAAFVINRKEPGVAPRLARTLRSSACGPGCAHAAPDRVK
jgi:hypothetical protein